MSPAFSWASDEKREVLPWPLQRTAEDRGQRDRGPVLPERSLASSRARRQPRTGGSIRYAKEVPSVFTEKEIHRLPKD